MTWFTAGTEGDVAEPEPTDFVELFRLHYGRVVVALRLAGAPPAVAEDLAQEAFARTFGHWRRVRHGSSPSGYVYRTAFRLLAKDRRVRPAPEVPPATSLEDEVASRVDLERLLALLAPQQRVCAALCWGLGFTSVEAGAVLDLDDATVRTHLARAAKHLRRES